MPVNAGTYCCIKVERSVSLGRTWMLSGTAPWRRDRADMFQCTRTVIPNARFPVVKVVCGTDIVRWSWSSRSFECLVSSRRFRPGTAAPVHSTPYINIEERLKDDTVADKEPVQGFGHRSDEFRECLKLAPSFKLRAKLQALHTATITRQRRSEIHTVHECQDVSRY